MVKNILRLHFDAGCWRRVPVFPEKEAGHAV